MSIFNMLLSVLVCSQLVAAAPAKMVGEILPPTISGQVKRAILSDNARMLAHLIRENDLSMNSIMINGNTKTSMLAFAAMNSKEEIVLYLAEQGAELIDINWHPDGVEYKDSLVNLAKSSGKSSMVTVLEGIELRWSENFLDEKSISAAAKRGNVDLIQNFLNNFEEVGKDKDKRLLAKKILDKALLLSLRSKELEVIESILSWRLAATTKEYLANLPAEVKPIHDEDVIKKAISLAKDIEEGQRYVNLASIISRIANVPPPTKVSEDVQPKEVKKLGQSSEALQELWQNLLDIASKTGGKEFVGWKFKQKYKISNAYTHSIKNGFIVHPYFSRIETMLTILKNKGANEEELDKLLLAFAEFTPVIPNSNMMAVKLSNGSKSAIDAAVEYAMNLRNGGTNNKADNLKMIYNGLKNLGNKEYIEYFEQLLGEHMLQRIL